MVKTGSKPTDTDDAQLIALALRDDQGAFTSLLLKYRNALIAYVMQKFVSVVEDAEDICQRSFEKAFMGIDRYDPRYAFSTWLYNIARNEAIDHLRRTRNNVPAFSYSDDPESAEIVAADTPEDKIIVDQAVQELVECIHSLPETYRSVAEMRFLRDLAYEDIASSLSLPIGTVKTRINRARKILMDMVSESDIKNEGN